MTCDSVSCVTCCQISGHRNVTHLVLEPALDEAGERLAHDVARAEHLQDRRLRLERARRRLRRFLHERADQRKRSDEPRELEREPGPQAEPQQLPREVEAHGRGHWSSHWPRQ